ncbi:MAG: hypothetical protein EBW87_00140 [Burkholderiaceae bacterium]|nr:hypothetical protein [Burkholderiaceae bacterium]
MLKDKILELSKQLYPTGRAFRINETSDFHKINKVLSESEANALDDAFSVLDSAIPDNSNFDEQDATMWERRLGLVTNSSVDLQTRIAAIVRKYNHPGTTPNRSHFLFLEKQLRDAGFDVYVHENRFWNGTNYFTMSPGDVSSSTGNVIQHGQIQHGQMQHGTQLFSIVVNDIDEGVDSLFNIGNNLRFTFFIGAAYPGDFADVDASRKIEFRQLILRAKPVHMVGYLFVNFI